MSTPPPSSLERFEQTLADMQSGSFVLTLFVAGASDRSMEAISNIRTLCERYLPGRYKLEVVDIHRDTESVSTANIIAAPTLIRTLPLPQRRLVGDLSNESRVRGMLEIRPDGARRTDA